MLAFTLVRVKTSDAFLGICLLLASAAFPIVLFAVPRSVAPRELPGLRLSQPAVDAVLRADANAAAQTPDDVHARALVELVHAQGEAEATAGEAPALAMERERNLRAVVDDVRAASGEAGLRALRARAVEELAPVMLHPRDDLSSDRVLGSFPNILERYQLTEGGRLRAPWFVVRTLYKARWNSICRLAPTFAFAPVEERAFHGWLALAASGASPRDRVDAIARYRRAGGTRGVEALAVLAYQAGEFDRAEELFTQLYVATGNIRFRDHARASSVEP